MIQLLAGPDRDGKNIVTRRQGAGKTLVVRAIGIVCMVEVEGNRAAARRSRYIEISPRAISFNSTRFIAKREKQFSAERSHIRDLKYQQPLFLSIEFERCPRVFKIALFFSIICCEDDRLFALDGFEAGDNSVFDVRWKKFQPRIVVRFAGER